MSVVEKIEEAFNALKEKGKNTAEDLTEWLKHVLAAQVVADEETEAKAKELLGEGEVEYQKFTDALKIIAEEQKALVNDYYSKLIDAVNSLTAQSEDKAAEVLADAKERASKEIGGFKEALERLKNDTSSTSIAAQLQERTNRMMDAAKHAFTGSPEK